ncbi:MAG: glycosyltransferase family 4 protein, partial [Candidatus Hodarchaeota archaeon]
MKVCLIASEFYPSIGGIGKSFTDMCKAFKLKNQNLFIFNRKFRGKNIFDFLDNASNYNLKDLLVLFKKREYFSYFLISIWKILTTKRLKFYYKLTMIIYLLINPKVLIKLIKNLSLIHPLLKKIKPDLIFGSTLGTTELPLGFILSRLMKKKFICSAHGTDFLVRTRYSLKTYFLKTIDKIIVSSNTNKEMIKKINHLSDYQLVVIPYGLYLQDYKIIQDVSVLKKELSIRQKDFILISVGRHVPRKNFQLVIQAIEILKKTKRYANFRYFLVGSGSETENLKYLTRILGLEEEVTFLGAVDDKMKNKYLKVSDVFIMPSIATKESIEGFGIVYLEANFYKLPVIGTISGGI